VDEVTLEVFLKSSFGFTLLITIPQLIYTHQSLPPEQAAHYHIFGREVRGGGIYKLAFRWLQKKASKFIFYYRGTSVISEVEPDKGNKSADMRSTKYLLEHHIHVTHDSRKD
jgi:hypothetical protein